MFICPVLTILYMSTLYCAFPDLVPCFDTVDLSIKFHNHRFYRVGGDNRIAGFLLAVATGILLVIGSAPIAFIRAFSRAAQIWPPSHSTICSCYGCRSSHLCFGD